MSARRFWVVVFLAFAVSGCSDDECSGPCFGLVELGDQCVNYYDYDEELPGLQVFCDVGGTDAAAVPACDEGLPGECWELRESGADCLPNHGEPYEVVVVDETNTVTTPTWVSCTLTYCAI